MKALSSRQVVFSDQEQASGLQWILWRVGQRSLIRSCCGVHLPVSNCCGLKGTLYQEAETVGRHFSPLMRRGAKVNGRKSRSSSESAIITAHYGSSLQNLCLGDSIEPITALLVQQGDPVRWALGLLVQLTLRLALFPPLLYSQDAAALLINTDYVYQCGRMTSICVCVCGMNCLQTGLVFV